MSHRLKLFQEMKQGATRLKPYLRWIILGGTLFFLAQILKDHWQEVATIRLNSAGVACLVIALGITLLAHIFSGWVWSWILKELGHPVAGSWGVLVYLKTNIAKYLPGNVWHFYGRIWAAKAADIPWDAATLSVLMEPLLMAAAALIVALTVTLLGSQTQQGWLQALSLIGVLLLVHPRVLNPLLKVLGQLKSKGQPPPVAAETGGGDRPQLKLHRYPLLPLLGEVTFLGLRGVGFLLTVLAVATVEPQQIPLLLSAFSLAWLLGLVVPGAPGGIGVFEVTAIALLDSQLSPGIILSSVALYRLISTLAEAGGAALAWLDEKGNHLYFCE